MKSIWKPLKLILSSVLRIIPYGIFIIGHIFWQVYTFTVNPLDLLDIRNLPKAIGEFGTLYLALGIMIFVFLTLGLKYIAYCLFFGGFIGQIFYFLNVWDVKVYGVNKPTFLYMWYILIFLGLIIGFLLQLARTGGIKYFRQKKYEKIRNINTK